MTRRPYGEAHFATLRDELLTSPLVGASTLTGPFETSRGFAATFCRTGAQTLVTRFPALGPHLEAVLGAPAIKALMPWYRRPREPLPNAWYLNVLLVTAGGEVSRHVDATLRKPAEVPDAVPQVVSVLYLDVPAGAQGGELRLWDGTEEVANVKPKQGALLHFRGDLAHAVLPFSGARDGARRASLVIEQYHLPVDGLAKLPDFQLDSRAGFEAFLEVHRRR